MAGNGDNEKKEILTKLNSYLEDKLPKAQAALLEDFAKRYYTSVSPSDLKLYSTEDLYGALLSHWNYVYQRKPNESKVLIFNPTAEKDGWTSKHTIILVSHDDIPFLVDSIRMEAARLGYQIHFAIHFGGLKVVRNENNEIVKVVPQDETDPKATSEAPIYMEIDRQIDSDAMDDLANNIQRVLQDVRVAVADWRKIVDRAEESLNELEKNPPPLDPAEISESKDFLRWLISNHFTFLGCRDYKLIGNETSRALQIIPGSGLGVLRDDNAGTVSRSYADLPPQARKLALSKNILIIAKTNTKATVHRATYTDYIGVKRFNEKGELIGERRFVGLYTSTAYHSSPRYIPFLRHKVAKVMEDLHFPPDSHNGKEVVHILETLPRDDLFQASHEELIELTMGILHLQERNRIRLFIRKDAFGRYFSCLVYVPREIFNTELCLAMQEILMHELQGVESTFATYFSDSVLARVHFLVRVNPVKPVDYNIEKLEKKIVAVASSWSDLLKDQLVSEFGEAIGLKYFSKYRRAFPASYTEYYLPSSAIDDIKKMEELSADNPLGMIFFKAGNSIRLKLFHTQHAFPLSDVLPTLEHMGLRVIGEHPHEIIFKDGSVTWLSDFDMVHTRNSNINLETINAIFQDAYANIWKRNAEDDGFNRLVIDAQMTWREIAVLRAYTKYLRQVGFTFSQDYIEEALINNAEVARNLAALFVMRFSPNLNKPDTSELIAKINASFDAVASLDEDRILRRLLEVILATLRTNYFQFDSKGRSKNHISFKLNPEAISDIPLPRPKYEIFVYSPRVEAVHLRGGKVARGGIRWSDRREDFRTEILGLMKAQQVKNSVIVPVGAKGGFFPKELPVNGDRDAIMKEVIECYSTFMRGMLDITDNIKEGSIVPPHDVVRYDEDDPYLVVAADKGTASFSDIANSISKEYEFWLDDAFASGGSAGYDHKKMAITARGAWESVKRHFRELNIDTNTTDFTVIGIGDMSGDVCGNGLLQSRHIKLVGAFDHRHIFVDPNPDSHTSFEERKRLFQLPRSSWMDYDSSLISSGGGIFNRSAKSIKITPEMKAAFAITEDLLVPAELIKAMLRAPVDLIFNGGIGTFVKASTELHSDVGDRTNDGIRVDGCELRAKVVGEGGNLGFTQLGRIEYSLNGGILYTDFIDNSAGVDCSDHEVNIKILLNKLVADGEMTLEQRNKLLEQMTDEIARLVLLDNYEQTQMVSLETSVAVQTIDIFRRYMAELEKRGRLNRKLEFLPTEKTLLERKANGQSLTRPEIAVLIAYCKMFVKEDILASDIPEDPFFINQLSLAFPEILSAQYFEQMKQHSLKREIIATQISKNITDHMGINFVERLQREAGVSVSFIVRAYAATERIFRMTDLWHEIELLDYKVSTAVQQKMMLQLYYLVRRSTRWFLRNRNPSMSIEATIAEFAAPIAELIKQLPQLLTKPDHEHFEADINSYVEKGVPVNLAMKIANCTILFTSLDIVDMATKSGLPVSDVAKTYYALGTHLDLTWLREQINVYPMNDLWDELARSSFRDDLDRAQSKLSVNILKSKLRNGSKKTIEDRITAWLKQNNRLVERWQNLLGDVQASNSVNYVAYSVILRELFDFAKVG